MGSAVVHARTGITGGSAKDAVEKTAQGLIVSAVEQRIQQAQHEISHRLLPGGESQVTLPRLGLGEGLDSAYIL